MAKSKVKNFAGHTVQLFAAPRGQFVQSPETVTLGKKIDRGGSSNIYPFPGPYGDNRVAKIYSLPPASASRQNLSAKSDILVRHASELMASLPFVIWPTALIADPSAAGAVGNRFIGIAMPRLPDGTVSLETIISAPVHESFLGTPKAAILASTIANHLQRLHDCSKLKLVFGDFNPKNIRVSSDYNTVTFIDADGFQIQAPNAQPLLSEGLFPGYGSPATIVAEKQKQRRTKGPEDDAFVLAIIIFRLLVPGGHPFMTGAKYLAPAGEETDEDSNIVARRYAFSNPGLFVPPGDTVVRFNTLSPRIKQAFTDTFVNGRPMTPGAWTQLLLATYDPYGIPPANPTAKSPGTAAPRTQNQSPPAFTPLPRPAPRPKQNRFPKLLSFVLFISVAAEAPYASFSYRKPPVVAVVGQAPQLIVGSSKSEDHAIPHAQANRTAIPDTPCLPTHPYQPCSRLTWPSTPPVEYQRLSPPTQSANQLKNLKSPLRTSDGTISQPPAPQRVAIMPTTNGWDPTLTMSSDIEPRIGDPRCSQPNAQYFPTLGRCRTLPPPKSTPHPSVR